MWATLTRKDLPVPTKVVDTSAYSTFKNIVISVVTLSKSFVVVCVHMHQVHALLFFLMISCFVLFFFCFFCGFLSSLTVSLFVVTLMLLWIQIVLKKENVYTCLIFTTLFRV